MHILNALLIGVGLGLFLNKFKTRVTCIITCLRILILTNGSILRLIEILCHSLCYPFIGTISEAEIFTSVWINIAVIQLVFSMTVYGVYNGVTYNVHLLVALVVGVEKMSYSQLECISAIDLSLILLIMSRKNGLLMYFYVSIVQLSVLVFLSWSSSEGVPVLWVMMLLVNFKNVAILFSK